MIKKCIYLNENEKKSLAIFLMVITIEMVMMIKMLSFLKHCLSARQRPAALQTLIHLSLPKTV